MDSPSPSPSAEADFMSMLVHQLSTPLGTMRWHAELLRMGKMTTPLDVGQADMVNEILLGATRMSDLLTDIHDISRLEQGKFTDEQASVALADLVSAVRDKHQAEIAAKNLKFTVDAGQSAPSVTARPSIMTVILQNLISNAVKYTPEGGAITVTLRPASAEEAARSEIQGADGVFISVADTGYGIPKDQHDKVFSKFFRADNISNLGIEGTGLGLAVVATAVSKLGGGVWFESEVGQGTTMFVVLPAKTRS